MKMVPWFTSLIGAYAGWWLGARLGYFAGFIASIVGGGIGLYVGRRWMLEHL